MKKSAVVMICLIGLSLISACSARDAVIAKVGRKKVTTAMLRERIANAPPYYQNYLATDAGKRQFLDIVIREQMVLEAARQSGTARTAEYRKKLAQFRKDQERSLREFEENLLMEQYIPQLQQAAVGSSDDEIRKYYEDHKAEYDRPVEITARHILVPTEEEAQKALDRIRRDEDFAKVAKEVSTDPVSASRGGEIGPFRKGDLVPEFEKEVFPLKIGALSPIVKTQYGYHVIKKTAEKVAAPISLEEARETIGKILEKNKFDAWVETARKKYNVKIYDNELAKVAIETQPESAEPQGAPMPRTPEAAGQTGAR